MSNLQKKSTRSWLPCLKPFYYRIFIDTLLNWSRKIGRTKIFHGSLHWEDEVHTVFATLRLSGDRVEMVVKVHCGTVLGTNLPPCWNASPKTVPQCTLTSISTRSPVQPQSGEIALFLSLARVLKLMLLSNFYYIKYCTIKGSGFSKCYNVSVV